MNNSAPETEKGNASFSQEVVRGLSAQPKYLPCRFFYDAEGASLFEAICHLPEYYPPLAETEILSQRSGELIELCHPTVVVIELGPGGAIKTRLILDRLLQECSCLEYIAIDISQDMLDEAVKSLQASYPMLPVVPVVGEYQDGLRTLQRNSQAQRLILWFGTSIGNLEPQESRDLLRSIRISLLPGDLFVIGIDLRKNKELLELAYNDSAGITARFNLNVLSRINRELGGHFSLDTFRHDVVYNEVAGRVEMYLVSQCDQSIPIDKLGLTVKFAAGEAIHTENSYKFSPQEIEGLAMETGFRLLRQWHDSNSLFSMNVFSPA